MNTSCWPAEASTTSGTRRFAERCETGGRPAFPRALYEPSAYGSTVIWCASTQKSRPWSCYECWASSVQQGGGTFKGGSTYDAPGGFCMGAIGDRSAQQRAMGVGAQLVPIGNGVRRAQSPTSSSDAASCSSGQHQEPAPVRAASSQRAAVFDSQREAIQRLTTEADAAEIAVNGAPHALSGAEPSAWPFAEGRFEQGDLRMRMFIKLPRGMIYRPCEVTLRTTDIDAVVIRVVSESAARMLTASSEMGDLQPWAPVCLVAIDSEDRLQVRVGVSLQPRRDNVLRALSIADYELLLSYLPPRAVRRTAALVPSRSPLALRATSLARLPPIGVTSGTLDTRPHSV